jgi:glycosyltransferase involved in cell wall biosynthesis
MRASVIIPTYQGAHRVGATLEALERQTRKDFELIIVVDGSTDGTAQIVRQQKTTLEIRVIEQANKGRAGARNAGAKQANGNLLVFYDDDIVPAPDSFERHVAFHDQHLDTILVGNTPQSIKGTQPDFYQYRAHLSLEWIRTYPDIPAPLQKNDLYMTAANCSMGKTVFQLLDGFTEKLYDAEDRELGIRAFKKNIPIYFDKDNKAWHDESITCRSYIRRLRQYAEASKMVNSMHPEFATVQASLRSGTRRWVYRWLASPWWVDAVDRSTVVGIIPKKIRYRLYSAITFALSDVYPEIAI